MRCQSYGNRLEGFLNAIYECACEFHVCFVIESWTIRFEGRMRFGCGWDCVWTRKVENLVLEWMFVSIGPVSQFIVVIGEPILNDV